MEDLICLMATVRTLKEEESLKLSSCGERFVGEIALHLRIVRRIAPSPQFQMAGLPTFRNCSEGETSSAKRKNP